MNWPEADGDRVAVAGDHDADQLLIGQHRAGASAGARPCTPLKPCESPRKYAGVFDEQPMPEIFATCHG